MKSIKSNKGITLVALIITIVVLLILAIVAIGAIRDSGIIHHAQNAADSYTIAAEKEQIGLAVSEYQIQKKIQGNTATLAGVLTTELSSVAQVGEVAEDGSITVIMNKTQNSYKVTEDGNIEGPLAVNEGGNPGGGNPPVVETDMPVATIGTKVTEKSTINGENYSSSNPVIPAGFAPVNVTTVGQESSWTAESGPEVNKGLVITDNVDENGNSTGNEFVWIPVAQISEIVMCKTHGTSKTIDQETLQCPDCGANTQLVGIVNNKTTYSETSNREPGIVTQVGTWNSTTSTTEYSDGADKDPSMLSKAGITDRVQNEGEGDGTVNEYDLLDQLEYEFKNMVTSVAKYGGFYVGRYETSLSGSIAQSIAGVKPATAANNSADTWYGLYAKSQTYPQSGVVSEMIWGCQYDAVMRFIGTQRANATGNVSHTSADFNTSPYATGGRDYSTNYKKTEGQEGYVPYNDIASNIYDLEGNVYEWTKEAIYTHVRVYRGGYYGGGGSPSSRLSRSPTTTTSGSGSRLALYVEL